MYFAGYVRELQRSGALERAFRAEDPFGMAHMHPIEPDGELFTCVERIIYGILQ